MAKRVEIDADEQEESQRPLQCGVEAKRAAPARGHAEHDERLNEQHQDSKGRTAYQKDHRDPGHWRASLAQDGRTHEFPRILKMFEEVAGRFPPRLLGNNDLL